ncbi:MAG: peptidoglycan DD-metalloendopeptidase family protein [Bdellovibrionales bacterium]|nr:peptidoglycan DD-metalloendopeptidase family protein [Bdellovibrionales bacterium]
MIGINASALRLFRARSATGSLTSFFFAAGFAFGVMLAAANTYAQEDVSNNLAQPEAGASPVPDSTPTEKRVKRKVLEDQLENVRTQRLAIEKALIEAEKAKKTTEQQLNRLKSLQKLQHQEKELTEKRIRDLEKYLDELQSRKEEVLKRMEQSKADLKVRFSKVIHSFLYHHDQLIRGDQDEGDKRVRERIISELASVELKSLETLRADLLDVEEMESRIEQEKQQITSLMQDISEQESLINFHRQLREDLTREKHEERLQQLDDYRKLKVSEVEIEKMISQFQEHQKLERAEDERKGTATSNIRPKSLPWPLKGKLVGTYGQHKDPTTGLNIFKKGIEISTVIEGATVNSVLDGNVQFAGEIPGKGRVMIVEHPHSLYTIYAGLKEMLKKVGDVVKSGEKLGAVGSQSPLYFEIRARNVAMDPIRWLE